MQYLGNLLFDFLQLIIHKTLKTPHNPLYLAC